MFVTDPAIPASVNVATMLAAVRGGLVATPATASQYNLPMGALPDSQKVGLDLRTMGWKKDLDAYRWAYHELSESLSRQGVAILDPAAFALRDYLLEFKIPILWISGPQDVEKNARASPDEELEFARDILMHWPPNIPCFGWPGSGDQPQGVSANGRVCGWRINAPSSRSAPAMMATLRPSVISRCIRALPQTLKQSAPPISLQRDKVYFCFTRSDGDGWNFLRHYYRKLFDDPDHGAVPIGWQVAPTAADGMPDILDYYYRHARPGDCFLNALTGVGYIQEDDYADNYPPEQREQILNQYMRLSASYRAKLDATGLTTIAEMRPARLQALAQIPGITAIFANYGRTHITTPENIVTEVAGRPVFRGY